MNRLYNKLQKFQLRNKLEKIFLKSNINTCAVYQGNIHISNYKMNNYYHGKFYRQQLINNSLNFSYSMNNKEEENKKEKIQLYNFENEIDYLKERDYIINLILKELSFEEIKIINDDPDFYIRNKFIRKILDLFNNNYLYKTLNNEENFGKDETEDKKLIRRIKEKKKEMKNNNSKKNITDYNTEGIDKEIKEEIKIMKIKKFQLQNQKKEKLIILKKIFSNTKDDIQKKLKFNFNLNNYLKLEKIKNEQIEKLKNNDSQKNYSFNNINSYNEFSEKNNRKIFKSISSHKLIKRKSTLNINTNQMVKENLEKKNQKMIKYYINEIKANLIKKEKKIYFPIISE
jgi:hypothetical protein